MLGACRTTVLLYDNLNNDLFRLKQIKGVERIESKIDGVSIGYKAAAGLGAISAQSRMVVSSTSGKEDTRFCQETDDPKGSDMDPASKVLAIPIVEAKGSSAKPVVKGVVVAVNKVTGDGFSAEDVGDAKAFCSLVAKVIEVLVYLL